VRVIYFEGLPAGVTLKTEDVIVIGTQSPDEEKEEKESA
jgi:hypothetical protein